LLLLDSQGNPPACSLGWARVQTLGLLTCLNPANPARRCSAKTPLASLTTGVLMMVTLLCLTGGEALTRKTGAVCRACPLSSRMRTPSLCDVSLRSC
jgi:hypothetical protein